MHPHSKCVLSCFSCAQLFVTPWTVAPQAPLSMGFSRQEYWSGLPALLQGIFRTQESNPPLLCLLLWQAGSLPRVPPGKPLILYIYKCTPGDIRDAGSIPGLGIFP